MTLLDRVVGLLDEHGIRHALIGAAAVAAAGIARSTYDLDLLTLDARVLQDGLWNGLRDDGVTVDVRQGDDADPLGGVVRAEAPSDRPVDVVLGKHAWQALAVERALRPPAGPPVVRPRDVILLKLYAGGSQDLWDVRELLRLPEGEQWIAEVAFDLTSLPEVMRARWENVRREP